MASLACAGVLFAGAALATQIRNIRERSRAKIERIRERSRAEIERSINDALKCDYTRHPEYVLPTGPEFTRPTTSEEIGKFQLRGADVHEAKWKPMDLIDCQWSELATALLDKVKIPGRLEAVLVVGATGSGKTASCIAAGVSAMAENEDLYVVFINVAELGLKDLLQHDPVLRGLAWAMVGLCQSDRQSMEKVVDLSVRKLLTPFLAPRLAAVKKIMREGEARQTAAESAMRFGYNVSYNKDYCHIAAEGIPLGGEERLVVIFDEAQDVMGSYDLEFPSRSETPGTTGLLSLLIHGTRSYGTNTLVVVNGTNSSAHGVKEALRRSGLCVSTGNVRVVLTAQPSTAEQVSKYLTFLKANGTQFGMPKNCASLAGRPRFAALYARNYPNEAKVAEEAEATAVTAAARILARVILNRLLEFKETEGLQRACDTLAQCVLGVAADAYDWPSPASADFALTAFGYFRNGCSALLHIEPAVLSELLAPVGGHQREEGEAGEAWAAIEQLKKEIWGVIDGVSDNLAVALRRISPSGAGTLFERCLFHRILVRRGEKLTNLLTDLGFGEPANMDDVVIPIDLRVRSCRTVAETQECIVQTLRSSGSAGVLVLPAHMIGPDIILAVCQKHKYYVVMLAVKFMDRPDHNRNMAQACINRPSHGGAVEEFCEGMKMLVKHEDTRTFAGACCYGAGGRECNGKLGVGDCFLSDCIEKVTIGHCSNMKLNKFMGKELSELVQTRGPAAFDAGRGESSFRRESSFRLLLRGAARPTCGCVPRALVAAGVCVCIVARVSASHGEVVRFDVVSPLRPTRCRCRAGWFLHV